MGAMYLMISPICEECKVCFLVRCKEAKKKKKKKNGMRFTRNYTLEYRSSLSAITW